MKLPCEIPSTPLQVAWRKEASGTGDSLVTVRLYTNGTTAMTAVHDDKRFDMDLEYSLIISTLEVADEAIFSCEVIRMDGQKIENATNLIVNGMPFNTCNFRTFILTIDGIFLKKRPASARALSYFSIEHNNFHILIFIILHSLSEKILIM